MRRRSFAFTRRFARRFSPGLARRFARQESGVALIEFALTLTVLLFVVYGAIDFGRVMFTLNKMTSAAREGARYGAAMTSINVPQIKQLVVNRMDSTSRLGNVNPDTSQVTVTCLTAANTSVSCTTATVRSVQVQIAYPIVWLTRVDALMGRTFKSTLTTRATFRWEMYTP